MGGVVGHFTVPDQQELRRFMLYIKNFSYFIGDTPVADKVQVKWSNSLHFILIPGAFKPAKGHMAYRAPCAMLKNNYRSVF